MHCRALALLLLLLVQHTAFPTSSDAPRQESHRNDLVAKVDALAAEQLAKPGGVGLSIAIAQRGEILLAKGNGRADAEFGAKADENTMFRIGSVTKQITAALVMRLVEEQKLALDDDLSKFVPELPLQGRRVTIEQLLQHTSGIKSYTELGEEWRKLWPIELTHAELLALVEDEPFDFEPGSGWHYSNTGYYLLGMVIEKISGQTYAAHLLSELCAPLGLQRTRYDSNRELIENRAQGYGMEGERLVNDYILGMAQPGAAGGLISTAGDLVRWQMALSSGRFVEPGSFARMCTPTVLPNGHDTGYGFGLEIVEWSGLRRVEHGGGIFGFNSILLWLPAEDLHVAVISNGEEISSTELADAIAHAALGTAPAIALDEPIPTELIARLSGEYEFAGIGMDARVFERDGALMLQATGQEAFRLLWQGGLEFRADFDTDVRLVFATDAASVVLHQGGKKADGVRK